MKKTEKQGKPLSFIKKLFLQLTASLLLLSLIYLSQKYAPEVFEKIKSNLTYTPDLSFINTSVQNFIREYTPH